MYQTLDYSFLFKNDALLLNIYDLQLHYEIEL